VVTAAERDADFWGFCWPGWLLKVTVASDAAAAFDLNYRGILGSCRFGELLGVIDIFQMQADVVDRCFKELGHLALGEPDGLGIDADNGDTLLTTDSP
jgi:hypothetical protein